MAARLADARMSERGVKPLPVAETFDLFGRLLESDVAQVGVMDVDWPRMLALYPNGGPSLLRELGGESKSAASAGRLREALLATAQSERSNLL
jgi:hypothetical protein